MTDDALWTSNDVARYLKASRSWVYQQAAAGTLPSLRIGGLLRFDPATIRAFGRDASSATTKLVALPLRIRNTSDL